MSLTVLITNLVLANRTGTEVVVEQLADGLRRRGHRAVIYAQTLGPLAQEMRARGHLVTDRPDGLPMRPDVIHGHHTAPCFAALAAHPGVPGLFVCHDATTAYDTLPPHPRVRRAFAVDERCRARLVAEGAAASQVSILPNAVDLSRGLPHPRLPERPGRAIAITKHATHLPALRAACHAAGIVLEEFGSGPGQMLARPEEAFARADIVFATARTAMEAAAAGAGVIVCDGRGCAGFLGRANAEAWLPWNLGAAILAFPTDEAQVAAAIAAWSAAEAEAATALVRDRCGIEPWLDGLETIYRDMLALPALDNAPAEAAAVGVFISRWVPHLDQDAAWRRLADQIGWPARGSPLDRVGQEIAGLAAAVAQTQAGLAAAIAQTQSGLDTAQAETEGALASVTADLREAVQAGSAAAQAAVAAHAQDTAIGLAGVFDRQALIEARVLAALDSTERRLDAALQGARPPPGLGARIESVLRGLWHRILPAAVRAPLHRLRRRVLAALRG
ncbi:glycosyltransferase [Humitalea sp. 24SJ18S-53]|uniref:glycosyltransferase family 4 protein n=1 Tax=Humitalea sp. 24SJ18S-53 TaxID=3422307 RepID=UPI003D66E65B